MNGTIRNHHLAFQIETLNDALDHHREQGTLDSAVGRQVQAMLAEKLALVDTPIANHVPNDGEPERRDLDKRPQAGARAANQFGDFAVKRASAAQMAFIRRLLAERDVSKASMRLPEIHDNLSKKVASSVIDILTACPVLVEKQAEVAAAALATEKQIAAILREGERRMYRADGPTAKTVAAARAGEPVDRADASAALDVLFEAPFRPRETTTTAAQLQVGSYQTPDGAVYRVYPARADRTRMLAKRWSRTTGDDGEGSWEYAGMASRFVKPEDLMTLAQAQAFGREFGVCADCGSELTDPTSRAFGVGPICRNKTRG